MKQYITKEEKDELTEEQHQELRKLYFRDLPEGTMFAGDPYLNWLPSIGDLIEFLELKHPEWRGVNVMHTPGGDYSFTRWMVSGNYDCGIKGTVFEKELCDALWKALKAVLAEEKGKD